MNDYLELLKYQFNNKITFQEKRPGIYQLIAPFYHEDGDMIDIFLEPTGQGRVRISDYGMTLMHLSYSYDIDTSNKERIFEKIITENGLNEQDGNIYFEIDSANLYAAILQYAQTVAKVSNMRQFRREVVQSLFYEMLDDFIFTNLNNYIPIKSEFPILERDDLEVDYAFHKGIKPVYLFGVKDPSKARLTTISCLEFQKAKLNFNSIVVHEEFDLLPKKDRSRLTSAADKQFTDLDDFKNNAEQYLEREMASGF